MQLGIAGGSAVGLALDCRGEEAEDLEMLSVGSSRLTSQDVFQRKIRTRLDLLSTPRSGGKIGQNV